MVCFTVLPHGYRYSGTKVHRFRVQLALQTDDPDFLTAPRPTLICIRIRSPKSRHLLSAALAENGCACAFWKGKGVRTGGRRSGKIVPTANESICPPYPSYPSYPAHPGPLMALLHLHNFLHANEPHISAVSCRLSTCFLVSLFAFIVLLPFFHFFLFPFARVVSCPALDWACYVKLWTFHSWVFFFRDPSSLALLFSPYPRLFNWDLKWCPGSPPSLPSPLSPVPAVCQLSSTQLLCIKISMQTPAIGINYGRDLQSRARYRKMGCSSGPDLCWPSKRQAHSPKTWPSLSWGLRYGTERNGDCLSDTLRGRRLDQVTNPKWRGR